MPMSLRQWLERNDSNTSGQVQYFSRKLANASPHVDHHIRHADANEIEGVGYRGVAIFQPYHLEASAKEQPLDPRTQVSIHFCLLYRLAPCSSGVGGVEINRQASRASSATSGI